MPARLHATDVMAIALRKPDAERFDRASAVLAVLRGQLEERERLLSRIDALQTGVGLIATDEMRNALLAQVDDVSSELMRTMRAALRVLEASGS